MSKVSKEQLGKMLDELQGIVNEMQAVNVELNRVNTVLAYDNNKLSVENSVHFNKVKSMIKENDELRMQLAVAKGEAESNMQYLIAERKKSWWKKLWS